MRQGGGTLVSKTTAGLVKRSTSYDPDVLRWLQERGQRLDRAVDWQVREILRAAMTAEQAGDGEAA
jgi:hypothetical protein